MNVQVLEVCLPLFRHRDEISLDRCAVHRLLGSKVVMGRCRVDLCIPQDRPEGGPFKSILRKVRRELAEKYVYDDSLSLSEISFLLGFSNISSFSRAFKRWTGFAPSTYRQVN